MMMIVMTSPNHPDRCISYNHQIRTLLPGLVFTPLLDKRQLNCCNASVFPPPRSGVATKKVPCLPLWYVAPMPFKPNAARHPHPTLFIGRVRCVGPASSQFMKPMRASTLVYSDHGNALRVMLAEITTPVINPHRPFITRVLTTSTNHHIEIVIYSWVGSWSIWPDYVHIRTMM